MTTIVDARYHEMHWISSTYWLDLSDGIPRWIIDIAATYTPRSKP